MAAAAASSTSKPAGAAKLPSIGDSELLFAWQRSNIYGADLKTLPAPNWLSDSTYEKFAAYPELFCYVPATTAFMIAATNDLEDITDAVSGCGISPETRLIFLPINNNVSVTRVGGSHWALLVFDSSAAKFFYFDSAGKSNLSSAHQLASKLCPFLLPAHYPLTPAMKAANKFNFKLSASHFAVADTPQQSNQYDCGVYTVTIAEQLSSQTVARLASAASTASTAANAANAATATAATATTATAVDSKSSAAAAAATGTNQSVITDSGEQAILFAALKTDAMNQKRSEIARFIETVKLKSKSK